MNTCRRRYHPCPFFTTFPFSQATTRTLLPRTASSAVACYLFGGRLGGRVGSAVRIYRGGGASAAGSWRKGERAEPGTPSFSIVSCKHCTPAVLVQSRLSSLLATALTECPVPGCGAALTPTIAPLHRASYCPRRMVLVAMLVLRRLLPSDVVTHIVCTHMSCTDWYSPRVVRC